MSVYTTYRWSGNSLRMLRIIREDEHTFQVTTAHGSHPDIGSRIEHIGIEYTANAVLNQWRTRTTSYDSARRALRSWCCRARNDRMYNRTFYGNTALRDLMGVRDEMPENIKEHWDAYCDACGHKHHMKLTPCPICKTYLTPQPASKNVRGLCEADYRCDACKMGGKY